MSWAALDDRFPTHRKRLELADSEHHDTAVALWTLGMAWCCGQEAERYTGFVPASVARSFALRGDVDAAAAALVRAGLWEVVDAPAGWTYHDWDQWNGPGARHRRSAEQTRLRVHRHRLSKCRAGEHDKDCPTLDLEGKPWECPRRAARAHSRAHADARSDAKRYANPESHDARNGAKRYAGPGRDGSGRVGKNAPETGTRIACPTCDQPMPVARYSDGGRLECGACAHRRSA